jgi:hypothetical protein
MSSFILTVLIIGGIAAAAAAMRSSAQRFAARKQRDGTWGPDGPLEPTDAPPGSGYPVSQYYLNKMVSELNEERFAADERARRANREAELAREGNAQRATVALKLSRNGQLVARISRADLSLLTEEVEADSAHPSRCFIDAATITALQGAGASEALLHVLRSAVGGGDGEDVEWTES